MQGSRDSRARRVGPAKRRAVLARDVDDRRGEVDDIVPPGSDFTRAISRTRRSPGAPSFGVRHGVTTNRELSLRPRPPGSTSPRRAPALRRNRPAPSRARSTRTRMPFESHVAESTARSSRRSTWCQGCSTSVPRREVGVAAELSLRRLRELIVELRLERGSTFLRRASTGSSPAGADPRDQ